MNWLWLLIPDWALVLVIMGIGIAVMVGAIRMRQALGLLGGILLFAVLSPFIESATELVFDSLPGWMVVIALLLLAFALIRATLQFLLGEAAAGHVVGALATDFIRFAFRVAFYPFRLLFRLILGRREFLAVLIVAVLSVGLSACGKSRSVAKGVSRSVAKRLLAKRPRTTLARDLYNHRHTPAVPLRQPRLVHRYTTAEQASRELRHGLGPNYHMTPNARTGRPITADNAQHRYGLPMRPDVRETIQLPKGFEVRHNRAIAGKPGYGELTAPGSLSADAIKKVTPLH